MFVLCFLYAAMAHAMPDKQLKLWSVTMRLWSREEEPGRWIAADTQELAGESQPSNFTTRTTL